VDHVNMAEYRDRWRALMNTNEPLDSVKVEGILGCTKDCHLLKAVA
jgi:hypothetical protein